MCEIIRRCIFSIDLRRVPLLDEKKVVRSVQETLETETTKAYDISW